MPSSRRCPRPTGCRRRRRQPPETTESPATTESTTTTVEPTTTTVDVEALKAEIAADYLRSWELRRELTANPTLDGLDEKLAQISAPGSEDYDNASELRSTSWSRRGERVVAGTPDEFRIDVESVELVGEPPHQEAVVTICFVEQHRPGRCQRQRRRRTSASSRRRSDDHVVARPNRVATRRWIRGPLAGPGGDRMPGRLAVVAVARSLATAVVPPRVAAQTPRLRGGRTTSATPTCRPLRAAAPRSRLRSRSRPSAPIRARQRRRRVVARAVPRRVRRGRWGRLAEVQAVWAAVNAEQAPDPSDPNYVEDVTNPGGDRSGGGDVLVPRRGHLDPGPVRGHVPRR